MTHRIGGYIGETGCCNINLFPFNSYGDLEIKATPDPSPRLEVETAVTIWEVERGNASCGGRKE